MRAKTKHYTLESAVYGASAGLLIGFAVFGLPALFLRFAHSEVIALIGMMVTAIFGMLLGIAESFIRPEQHKV